MEMFPVYPIHEIPVVKARGSWVWDDQGTRYLDMYGGHAVISIGHTHPHWTRRIEEQMRRIAFYSNSVRMPIQDELAEKLGQVSGLEEYRLFLVNSGAEANENALKLASFFTGRRKVVAFDKAFHGRTSLAVSVTDSPAYRAPVNETDSVTFLPFNDEKALEDFFQQEGKNIAAVIVEGIQGVGGIRVATASFLQTIRRLCDTWGALYVADGVQCGYGRTGQFYAHDYAGVKADLYSMAKGMGNGFPIGGIAIAPRIPAKAFQLGTTFGGNPLACAAALAVLEVMESQDLMDHAARMGDWLLDRLREMPGITAVRGRGLMIGFDVLPGWESLKSELLFGQKVFTGEAKPSAIRLLPALTLSPDEARYFVDRLHETLKKLAPQS